ncbi:MAG: MarR family transcriptional regulator [Roseburia sp.]|nr:MarR family transcriptional regulator [Roseburia sp.]
MVIKMSEYPRNFMKRYNHLLGELDAVYHEISLKFGMSDSAVRILYTLCDNDDCCLLRDICLLSGLSKQTVNSALRKLETEGIVYLKASGQKHKSVCLTEKGRQLADRTVRLILRAENEIFESWPQEDVGKYMELTERFLEDMKEKAKQL